MSDNTQQYIAAAWNDRVRGKPIYHGMSTVNLTVPLDPANNPFAAVLPTLCRLLDVLQALVDAGFKFTVREEHFGQQYAHDLRLIVAWTRRDLDNPGIDFTTSYYDACGYADCCQGSQLKENFQYITTYLPDCKGDPVVGERMGRGEWALVDEVRNWISGDASRHQSVVLHADRSCPAFDADSRCQPVGSLAAFTDKVRAALSAAGLECRPETIAQVLPTEEEGFTVRMHGLLTKEYVMAVEVVTPERVAQASGPRAVG
jgi:hypothetical protein